MSKTEKWILILGFVALWIGLAAFAGGPIFSDEMLYIDVGLRNLSEPHYGNRYFHIYLQKFFMALAPTPLKGIRVFWGLLMAATSALVYFNARRFSEKSTVLHGLLAVAFFFSFSIVREYSGEPAVDITAMAIVILYVTIYLEMLKHPEKENRYLFCLGMLAFLGFKTKETTIFVHILPLGYWIDSLRKKDWAKRTMGILKFALLGFASGILIFIIMDGLILGKPFFAISPSTFQGVFDNYDFQPGFIFGPTSWFTEYLLDDILLAFILFIAGGVLHQKDIENNKRVLWLYPLLFIAFLSWNMLKVPWGFIERFFFPALPVIAILAPQALQFKWPAKKTEWTWFISGLVMLFVLSLGMREVWLRTARTFTFDYGLLIEAIYFPILISILLAVLIWKRNLDWKWSLVQLFCIGTLLFSPLAGNLKYFAVYPQVRERYQEVFYPFSVFSSELNIKEDDYFYISTNVKNELDMLSSDPNDITGMYNFFFDERIGKKNIFIGYDRKKVAADLLKRDFSYALLTGYDVETLKLTPSWKLITGEFGTVLKDSEETIYLLINKE